LGAAVGEDLQRHRRGVEPIGYAALDYFARLLTELIHQDRCDTWHTLTVSSFRFVRRQLCDWRRADYREAAQVSRLVGKVAIVTGGAGGIGAATVQALAGRGASVAVVDIDASKAADVAAEVAASGGDAIALGSDLSVESAAKAAVQSTLARFGRLDILYNNAALTASDFLSRDTTVPEMALDVWERSVAVNLGSQMLMCKHAIPAMVRTGGGSIINMSSGAALSGDLPASLMPSPRPV
jgi:hypothetical protein